MQIEKLLVQIFAFSMLEVKKNRLLLNVTFHVYLDSFDVSPHQNLLPLTRLHLARAIHYPLNGTPNCHICTHCGGDVSEIATSSPLWYLPNKFRQRDRSRIRVLCPHVRPEIKSATGGAFPEWWIGVAIGQAENHSQRVVEGEFGDKCRLLFTPCTAYFGIFEWRF